MNFREEIIGDARLILGDCREILPTLGKVDAVVTDPPYGIGFGEKHTKWSANRGVALGSWDAEIPNLEFLLNVADHLIIWGGERFSLPIRRGWLTWVKPDAAPTFASTEFAWTNRDCPARHFTMTIGAVNAERIGHPTQKPVKLMEWCLSALPSPTQTVLDPFMGSGTTGIACHSRGLKFTGIEREQQYFDIACKRIERAYAQPRLFKDQPPKPVQLDILDV